MPFLPDGIPQPRASEPPPFNIFSIAIASVPHLFAKQRVDASAQGLRLTCQGFYGTALTISLRKKRDYGQVYCRKDAKNFGQWRFLSAREIEHGQFRALFAGSFWPKMQNGRTLLKSSDY
jgi:hypothetical protein